MRHPIPSVGELAQLYEIAPADIMDYEPDQNAAWLRTRRRLLQRFSDRTPLKVLDIGCHTGGFLSTLPAKWQRFGIESSIAAIEVAIKHREVHVIAPRIGEQDPEHDGAYDVVTMFDVLEHLVDPAGAIDQAIRLLRPGGWLCVSTGDMDAWTWRWLGSQHWYLQTPQHISVLSRSFLRSFASSRRVVLLTQERTPHRLSTISARLADATRLLYWGMRIKGGIHRIPHRIIQTLPGLRHLRHMCSVPWAMTLNDHVLAIYER